MITNEQAIFISVVLFAYYLYMIAIAPILKVGQVYNTPNARISKLRRDYGVKIQTFYKRTGQLGYVSFGVIYLNERLLKETKKLAKKGFTLEKVFLHEYYHYLHMHKAKQMTIRLIIALTPLLCIVINQYIVLGIFACALLLSHHIEHTVFENNANKYADEQNECKKA